MHLEVTFRNLAAREEVNRRAQALYKKLHRFLEPASEGTMTVSIEHGKAIIDLVVQSHGHTYKAEQEHDELRAAIDTAFHRMDAQLRRSKERRVRRGRGNTDEFEVPNDTGDAEDEFVS